MRACVLQRIFAVALISSGLIFAGACGSSDVPRIGIDVKPLCVVLAPGGSSQFDAEIFINEVSQGIDNSAVTWSVLGGDVNGTVSPDGFFQAPNTIPPPAPQVQVIATSIEDDQKSGQATVILTPTPDPTPNPCAAPPP